MNGLDLFSGIGGISIALKPWIRTVAYCERDRYAQAVLLSRMASYELDRAPIWDDVTSLRGSMLPSIDIIFGGFPCQDISVAGTGKGLAGERSGLFREIVRLTEEIRPSFVFLENVPAILTRGLEEVIKAFTEIRYDSRWTCLSAASVGAPHKRERWFLLAHSDCGHSQNFLQQTKEWEKDLNARGACSQESLADSLCSRLQRFSWPGEPRSDGQVEVGSSCIFYRQIWSTEPNVARVANGVQFRVDRIKCLGNAVVPEQARKAFKKLVGLERGADC